MLVNSKKLIKLLEERYPGSLAAEWDNVGFQVGNINSAVNKVLVALEVTPAVVEEAIEINADLIVCHHPLIFRPIKSLTEDQPLAAMLRKLTTSRIGVYVAHTNADAAPGGTVDILLKVLGLTRVDTFGDLTTDVSYKLAVYVPADQSEQVLEAMFTAGAGRLGAYKDCSFSVQGTGTFLPLEGAKPTIGQIGSRTNVEERKMEVLVQYRKVKMVVQAMLAAHPYELPAYELWPLEEPVIHYGFGAVAIAENPMKLSDWALRVKRVLKSPMLRMVGEPDAMIRRIAVVPGAGAGFYKEAVRLGCDLLITGDVKYHEAQDARMAGIHLIDAGHFETELPFVGQMASLLKSEIEEKGYDVRVVESEVKVNPFSIDF
jgi:dinuclear metal center YbgI/SA1388 family protein